MSNYSKCKSYRTRGDLRLIQSCPRVGWTRGSGRVGSGRVGSRKVTRGQLWSDHMKSLWIEDIVENKFEFN